ncbi:uncharacterized protein LOC134825160 [Bolinopsis microptera]|uniref:uncharacterized protein LOC134825160 n=1 Tax=Bolinopsis microptera TaxID=2820187 RepID=UPI00307AC589
MFLYYTLFLFSSLFCGTISEPVRKCLSNDVFQKASCEQVRDFISGRWAEVRRLPLPFLMYNEEDCVVWNAVPRSMNDTDAEFHLQALVGGQPVEGMMPAVLKVEQKKGCDSCKVSMHIEVPKLQITRTIPDWWITFDDDHQVMVGYVCVHNHIDAEKEKGLMFRNMIFIYMKPQLTPGNVKRVKKNLDIIVDRLSDELKDLEEETDSHWEELRDSKCKMVV